MVYMIIVSITGIKFYPITPTTIYPGMICHERVANTFIVYSESKNNCTVIISRILAIVCDVFLLSCFTSIMQASLYGIEKSNNSVCVLLNRS